MLARAVMSSSFSADRTFRMLNICSAMSRGRRAGRARVPKADGGGADVGGCAEVVEQADDQPRRPAPFAPGLQVGLGTLLDVSTDDDLVIRRRRAGPGPHDANYLFDEFIAQMRAHREQLKRIVQVDQHRER